MFQASYHVHSVSELDTCLKSFQTDCPEIRPDGLLVSVFSYILDCQVIKEAVDRITRTFPQAAVTGLTTAGEFLGEDLWTDGITIVFYAFEHTKVRTFHYDLNEMTAEQAGELLRHACGRVKKLKGVEVLGTLRTIAVESCLEKLEDLDPSIGVFGGGADYSTEADHMGVVFDRDGIYDTGIVAALFEGDVYIRSQYVLGWHPLGLRIKITKMEGSRIIKELNDRPAVEIYEEYLKFTPKKNLTSNLLPFPLMLDRDGVLLPRIPMDSREDGSLVFDLECRLGDTVRLSYGDPEAIIDASCRTAVMLKKLQPEAMLNFSCATRRNLFGESVHRISEAYNEAAPLTGASVNGEICRSNGKIVTLNLASVTVVFREKALDQLPAEEKLLRESFSLENMTLEQGKNLTYIQRLAILVSTTSSELERAYRDLQFTASHDGMTKLLNRGTIETYLIRALETEDAAQFMPLSVIMVDVDSFKSINDTYGHQTGDQVLMRIADMIRDNSRSMDSVGRWGGDEFVIILPKTTQENASAVAERMRASMLQDEFLNRQLGVTASFGVTEAKPNETMGELYKRIDNALYTAKLSGKNRVYYADEMEKQ